MKYISNKKIQEWLDEGFCIYSCTAGRIGQVIEVSEHGDVVIKSARMGVGRCVTTFESGDEVTALKSLGIIRIVSARQ